MNNHNFVYIDHNQVYNFQRKFSLEILELILERIYAFFDLNYI